MGMIKPSSFIFLNHVLWKIFLSTPFLGIANTEVFAFLRENQEKICAHFLSIKYKSDRKCNRFKREILYEVNSYNNATSFFENHFQVNAV
jgi:hypothetical protein